MEKSRYINIFLGAYQFKLAPSTIVSKRSKIETLLSYFESIGKNNLMEVTKEDIYNFFIIKNYSSQSRSARQFEYRHFFNQMYKNGLSNFSGDTLYPVIFTNKRDRLISCYTEKEIKNMIEAIDVSVKSGLRDKCIVVLLAQTGLRVSDVVHLKFDEIIWDKNEILKIQQKTKETVCVTITDQAKLMLIDYIKNSRPKIKSEYVFLKHVKNFEVLNPGYISGFIRKTFSKCSVNIENKRAGAHSLRHSLATNMVRNNTPLPVIKGILGHTTISTTQRYISLDIEGLRKVSLEVPLYE